MFSIQGLNLGLPYCGQILLPSDTLREANKISYAGTILEVNCLDSIPPLKQSSILTLPNRGKEHIEYRKAPNNFCVCLSGNYQKKISGKPPGPREVLMKFKGRLLCSHEHACFHDFVYNLSLLLQMHVSAYSLEANPFHPGMQTYMLL